MAKLSNSNTGHQGRKNLIINGAMQVCQRAKPFALAVADAGDYTMDRWQFGAAGSNTATFQISQVASTSTSIRHAGLPNQMLIDVTGADASVSAGDLFGIKQPIEGLDVQRLGWGYTGAKPVTLSFWTFSAAAGTYTGAILVNGGVYSYTFEYTCQAGTDWQKHVIVIPGCTDDVIDNDNTEGLTVFFGLICGSTFQTTAGSWTSGLYYGTSNQTVFTSSTDNELYISGIQLEEGTEATDFDHKSPAEELHLCHRYYYKLNETNYDAQPAGTGVCLDANQLSLTLKLPVNMRTSPTLSATSTAGDYFILINGGGGACSSVPTLGVASDTLIMINAFKTSSLTAGEAGILYLTSAADGYIAIDSEI